jgi:hypothetical protein
MVEDEGEGEDGTVTRLGRRRNSEPRIKQLGSSPTEWIIDASRVSSGLTDTPKA